MRGQIPSYEDPGTAGLLAAAILNRPEIGAIAPPRNEAIEWLYETFRSCLGTGGRVSEMAECGLERTSVYVVVEWPRTPRGAAVLHDTAQRIALIRATLSLNVKELAAVLQVERPTVYAWMGGEVEPKARNYSRIEAIWTLAREWEKLSPLPLGTLRNAVDEGGTSVLELLMGATIDTERIQHLMRTAAGKVMAEHTKPHGLGLRERARRKGVILATPPDAQRQIDVRTGKRMGPE